MARVHAIRIHQTGGPEAMRWEEVEVGDPGPGQVRIRHSAFWPGSVSGVADDSSDGPADRFVAQGETV